MTLCLNPVRIRGSSTLYTRTRLILTFVIMSRWTTLDLRRLMWNPGLS
jgi:hypothetical protein